MKKKTIIYSGIACVAIISIATFFIWRSTDYTPPVVMDCDLNYLYPEYVKHLQEYHNETTSFIPLYSNGGIFYDTETNRIIMPLSVTILEKTHDVQHFAYTIILDGVYFPRQSLLMLPYSRITATIAQRGERMIIRSQRNIFVRYGYTDYYNYLQIIDPREHYHTIVILDPGHGGFDPGAPSAAGSEYPNEATINLAITMKVLELFDSPGTLIIPTRTENATVLNRNRYRMANAIGDYFISLHGNGDTSPLSHGTLTLYGMAEGSVELAESIQGAITYALGSRDRGISHDPAIMILRNSNIPIALAEILFMSNPTEARKLADPEIQWLLAETLVNVILELPPARTIS